MVTITSAACAKNSVVPPSIGLVKRGLMIAASMFSAPSS